MIGGPELEGSTIRVRRFSGSHPAPTTLQPLYSTLRPRDRVALRTSYEGRLRVGGGLTNSELPVIRVVPFVVTKGT